MKFLGKIDLFFSSVVSWFIYKLGYLIIALLGLLALVFIPLTFLEYGEGFSDLDISEGSLIALTLLMLWRFVSKAVSSGYDKWTTTKRLFIVLTAGLLFPFFVESFLLYYLLETQGYITSAYYLLQAEWMEFFDAITLIALLYGLAPCATINYAAEDKEVDSDNEIKSEPVAKADLWGAKKA